MMPNRNNPGDSAFPQNPSRDEMAERELLEIIFTLPETDDTHPRGNQRSTDLTNSPFKQLLELCFQMQDEGGLPSFERVITRLEDAGTQEPGGRHRPSRA